VLYIRSFLDEGMAVGVGRTGISHQVSAVSTEEVLERVDEVIVEVILLRGDELEVVELFVDVCEDKGRGLDIRTRAGEGRSDGWKLIGSERVREFGDRGCRGEYRERSELG